MKKIATALFGLCALGLFANTTLAATISILPTSTEAFINDPIMVAIEGQGFSHSVDTAWVTVSWDPNILSYSGITVADPPWDSSYIDDSNAAYGIIDTIFTGSSEGAGTDFLLAHLDFTALSLGSTKIVVSAFEGECETGACGIFSKDVELFPEYTQAKVNVIPVPAAVWLFGTGLLGLIGFMRKK
jgi:hypothetical protein